VPKLRIFLVFIQICTFSLSISLFVSSLFADQVANPIVDQNNAPSAVPTWLIQKPFRVLQKVSILLDGGKDAAGLKRQSENESRLLFVDAGHWRTRHELPFTGQAREILKNDAGFHRMTLYYHATTPTEKIADDAWTQLVKLPHDLSKRWGFIAIDSSWGDWISQIKDLKEPYKNSDGDSVRVSIIKTGDVEKTFVVLEGSLPHEDSTRMKIKVEWTLEQNIEIKAEDLNKSLLGGA